VFVEGVIPIVIELQLLIAEELGAVLGEQGADVLGAQLLVQEVAGVG
jgi:hypothetical protein